MTTFENDRTALSVKKHAGTKLRALGIADPNALGAHALSWGDLNKRQRGVADIARGLLDSLTENLSEAETRSLGEAHEGLMEIFDVFATEKDWRTETGNREARQHGGSPHRPNHGDMVVAAADDGSGGYLPRHRARPDDGEEASCSLRHDQRMTDWAHEENRAQEIRGLTTAGLLRAMVLGPKSDVERRALAEGTDSAGGYTVPDIVSAQMIDRMRAASVISRAGARTVPLTSDVNYIAKVLTDPVPAWRAENAEIGNSDATFGRVELLPKSLAVLCRVSRELLEDSLNINTVLPQIIAQAMALEVDRMALFGSGVAPEPLGLSGISGVGAVALGGTLGSHANGVYGSLIAARGQLLAANAPEPTAFVMHPREDQTLAAARGGDGNPLIVPPKIATIPQLVTTSVPTNGGVGTNESSIIAGYFPAMLLGVRNTLRIEILKERYAEFHQYAFIAHLRATVAVEQAAAFAKVTGIKP